MKLRHIYINKEGEPMGNPDPDSELLLIWESREEKIKQYHSGLLPFEDREEALIELEAQAQILKLQPDTLIPVDIEVEVVDVFTKEEMLKIAQGDGFGHSTKYVPSKNRVLRIKN